MREIIIGDNNTGLVGLYSSSENGAVGFIHGSRRLLKGLAHTVWSGSPKSGLLSLPEESVHPKGCQ